MDLTIKPRMTFPGRRWLVLLLLALLGGSEVAVRAEGGGASDTAPASTSTWWDKAWAARKKITIDTTQAGGNITDKVGDITVLLRLDSGTQPSNYPQTAKFAAKEDLSDVRFVAEDDKTLLPFHVEKVDQMMGGAFVWVKVPAVPANGKVNFWMYFGSTDPKATKVDDSKASYDADTVAIFHFSDSGNPTDSTKENNSTDVPGGKADQSFIGGGASFNGKTPIAIAASPSLMWTDGAPMTLCVWVKLANTPSNAVFLSRREGGKSFTLGAESGKPYLDVNGQRGTAAQPLAAGSWAHLAVVCEGGKSTLYVNGETAGAAPAGLPGMNSPIIVGGETSGFSGEMDELQIHKAARSTGFVQFTANGQNSERSAAMIKFSGAEAPSNWLSFLTTGTFGVIVQSLEPIDWGIIAVLAIMFLLSFYVMFNKVRYLNSLVKGNKLFMEQWAHVAADLTVLDDGDAESMRTLGGRVTKEESKKLKYSSVYRIYHIGADEIRQRLDADREAGNQVGLAGRSIQAVRASLDGGMVHETQKLNKSIVLLTICISGGPFIGLLGTVIGVMITFAAVAAAGDVNVNAIAPGIAAALAATVAGLFVAIPSLFGYNYILSRVKDAKDDMHIFIDEFVARMAEFYKER